MAVNFNSAFPVVADSVSPASTDAAVVVKMAGSPAANGGGPASTSRILTAAASTNGTQAKASAGVLYHVTGQNMAAAARFLRFYNVASGLSVGTTTPTHTFYIPGGASFRFDWPQGYYFSTGIAYSLTAGSTADNDTTALTAGDILGLVVEYV